MSRTPVDEGKRLRLTSVTLNKESCDAVESLGKGSSFSEKLRSVIKIASDLSVILFHYDTDEQIEMESPTVLKHGAVQVYCESAGKHGVVTDEPEILGLFGNLGNKKGNVAATIASRLEKAGYIVQVSENPVDVWAVKKIEDNAVCRQCEVLKELRLCIDKTLELGR